VLYGEDDLEELLDYYLTHDAERERIAEAGWRKVQAHSYAHHVAQAMNTIEAAMAEKPRAARPFLSLPTGERLFRHACQRLLMDPRNLGPAEEALIEAERLLPARSDIANARACTLARFAECLPDGPERRAAAQQAARHVRRALELQPDDAVAWFNLAQIQLALSNPIIAADALHRAITLLQAENLRAEQVRGPYHAAQFQAFAVELESVWCTHRAETEAWVEGLRSVLLWRAWEQLSDIAFESGRFAEAAETAARAIALRPNLSGTRYRRARALRMLGMLGEAETEYRRALAETPLHPQMWVELAEMLRDSKQYDKCRNFLAEVEDMVNGCPCYEPFRPGLQTLFATLEQAACAGVGRTLRLLALPDWNLPEQWQPLLRRYVQHFGSEEPVLLALPVEPERHPCVEAIVAGVERFLQEAFGASLDSIPDVTLWPYPSEPAFRSLPQADAMVQTRGPEDAQQAAALGVPLFAPEHLARIRT
jgi:tetratricopeptide (TPR) repeat protein